MVLGENIDLIIGFPGTGKTTYLKNKVLEEIQQLNYLPEEIAFHTFTKRESMHAKEVVMDLGFKEKELIWFRTIHSACFRLLELEPKQVVLDKHKIDFCKELGKEFHSKTALELETGAEDFEELFDTGKIHSTSTTPNPNLKVFYEGNLLLSIIDWCRINYPGVKNPVSQFYYQCPLARPEKLKKMWKKNLISYDRLDSQFMFTIALKWAQFKQKNFLYDFTDMLTSVLHQGLRPNIRILFVDEVQDLSPLQWKLVELWGDYCDRVYVAGDPNQSIYGWAGAKPELFLNYTGKKKILKFTYRLCEQHLAYAKRLIQDKKIQQVESKKTKAGTIGNLDEGSLLNLLDQYYKQERRTFCLVRTNYFVKKLSEKLVEQGIPFSIEGKKHQVWTLDLQIIIEILKLLQDIANPGWSLSWVQFSTFIRLLPAKKSGMIRQLKRDVVSLEAEKPVKRFGDNNEVISLPILKLQDKISKQTLCNCFPNTSNLKYLFSKASLIELLKISEIQKQALTKFDLRNKFHSPNIIVISTIHKSKGLEKPAVIVFKEITHLINREIRKNHLKAQEERRVFYVACTRSEDELFFVNNIFGSKYMYNELPGYSDLILKPKNIRNMVAASE